MILEIREIPFEKTLYGCHKAVGEGQKPADAMFAAMDETWGIVRQNKIANGGLNHVLYTSNRSVFAGLEIEPPILAVWGLAEMRVSFPRYAYCRHAGSYDLLGEAYQFITKEIAARGLATSAMSMEIYGHWNEDAAKLVTEILVALE